jgi:hypothetical protein
MKYNLYKQMRESAHKQSCAVQPETFDRATAYVLNITYRFTLIKILPVHWLSRD